MKCSQCQRYLKPVVAVDIDGTLGDYYLHFHQFMEMYVGRMLPDDYAGDTEYSDHLLLDKQVYRDAKLAYRQGGMKRSMPVYPGAIQFMHELRELDIEIWIATTRPWMRLDNIDPDTRHWLERNNIPWDYMIYGEDKYKQLLSTVDHERVLVVVDDLKEQDKEADSQGLVAFQPSREHNRKSTWHNRFTRFEEMMDLIEPTAIRWKENHGGAG